MIFARNGKSDMTTPQIVGSIQVRNEDIYIEQVVSNVVDFCDRIIISDHRSTDHTFEICHRFSERYSKVELISIQTPREAAVAIEPFFGTNTWIFGVDGDEIYDPAGLQTMRRHLLDGTFSKDWCLFGNVLNVTSLNRRQNTASGYLAPPSRPMTKLYNFSIIEGWDNCPERLLGDEIRFKPGFNAKLRKYLHLELAWEDSYFRCLHMPFMRRSSQERIRVARTRPNPDEINRINLEKKAWKRLMRMIQVWALPFLGVDWKSRKYRQGPLVEKEVSPFFRDRGLNM